MKLTTFQSKKTQHKIPISPFDDNTFIFETKDATLEEVFWALSSSFVLNIPLTKNIKTYRRKKDLDPFFVKKLSYLIIDIDHIETVSDKELCINYFRTNNYKCIIGESRNELNLKGVLAVDCTLQKAKSIVDEINKNIPGDFDYRVLSKGGYQAPTFKHKILYKNLDGALPVPVVSSTKRLPSPKTQYQDVQEMCKTEFENLGFEFCENKGDFYVVKHYSEKKSPKGFRWYPDSPFTMHHWNPARNVNIFNTIRKTKEYKKIIKLKKLEEIKKLIQTPNFNCNERYLSDHKELVVDFLNSDKKILKVQSPMGTNKSGIIYSVMEEAKEKGYRVLFITNRISLADDISEKYGIKHYLGTQIEGNDYQEGDSLVVQIDSLHKFSTKFFDIVILDEFSTTLQKILNLERHQKKIVSQFFSLKKKKIIALDAIIFDKILELFQPKEHWIELNNEYRDKLDLFFYDNKDYFMQKLIDTAEKEPITFSSTSNLILDAAKRLLDEKGIESIIIRSDTSKEEKRLIYKSFKRKKPKWRVIMYSPTLTVGLSNLNETHQHFHYDTGLSADVLSSLQMTKRTRNAKGIHFFLDQKIDYKKTDLKEIQNNLTDFHSMDDDGDFVGLSETGKKISTVIQVYNTLENLHKDAFLRLMFFQFKKDTELIHKIKNKTTPFLNKVIKIVKKEQKEGKLNLLQEYKKMDPGEVSVIISKLYCTKEEELIKLFEFYKDELRLQGYNTEEIYKILEEEINYPGLIDCLLKNDNLKNILVKNTYDKKLKPCYVKKGNRWYLNKTLKNLREM